MVSLETICLYIVDGFWATRERAELSCCDTDIMAWKAKYIYYLVSYKREYIPTFYIKDHNFLLKDPGDVQWSLYISIFKIPDFL